MDQLTLGLSLATAVSAALCVRAVYAGRRWQVYLFKPLTTSLIIALAWLAPASPSLLLKGAVVIGLVFSLLGDICLMLPSVPFVAGLVSFLLAHLSYSVGFGAIAIPRASVFWLLWLIPYVLYGAWLQRRLMPHVASLRLPVSLYMGALLLMAWLATGVNWRAGLGAALFVISDSVLAYERFVRPFHSARWIVLGSYWLAQWWIALSLR